MYTPPHALDSRDVDVPAVGVRRLGLVRDAGAASERVGISLRNKTKKALRKEDFFEPTETEDEIFKNVVKIWILLYIVSIHIHIPSPC